MSSDLDMSLDDLTRRNKGSRSGPSRPPPGGPAPAPSRRFQNPGPYCRAAPFAAAQVPMPMMFPAASAFYQPQAGQGLAAETGMKIYVSNLDYGVSNEDLKELFSEVGDLKRYGIHYDRNGQSKGTAEVIFSRRPEALAAIKRYNNVQLDGKPMKIQLLGTTIANPPPPPPPIVPFESFNRASRWGGGRGGPMGRPRGGGGRGSGPGHERGRGRRSEKISAEELDADLDKHRSNAAQIN